MDLIPQTTKLDRVIFTCQGFRVWTDVQIDQSIKGGVKSLLTEFSPEYYLECHIDDWVWIKLKYAELVWKTAKYKENKNA